MRKTLLIALLLSVATGPAVVAQSGDVSLRVEKLEKEMKAVQRKVFPGGNVQPEIATPTETGDAGGTPATAPITDLTARVDAIEAQLKTLTGQGEVDGNRIKKLEEAVKVLQAANAPPPVTEPAAATAPVSTPAVTKAVSTPTSRPAIAAPAVAKPAAKTTAKADPARVRAIAAVELPDTGDAAEDAYSYGFRLWSAKLYPEAQVKLKEFAGKYAKHKRASYAQNLLGRAYLDEGKPALASVAFYENYTKNPKGERASESLYWLGVALTRLKKLPDACKVFDEFGDVYGATAASDLKARVAKARGDARCTA